MVLDTRDDRTIFFDLLPFFLVTPGGLKVKIKVKIKVYTVPGQVKHDATRKAVLQRADGVAFIADSQLTEVANNFPSFENLEKNPDFYRTKPWCDLDLKLLEKRATNITRMERDYDGNLILPDISGEDFSAIVARCEREFS